MRSNIFKTLPLLGTLLIAGCGITNPFTGQPITAQDVQNATVAACGFLPTAATIADIIATGNSNVQSGAQIAALICGAVTGTKSARRGGALPTVNGVVIRGTFVQGRFVR